MARRTPIPDAAQRSDGTLGPALLRLANYCVAQFGYLLPSALLLLWAVPPGRRREALGLLARSMVRPSLQRELWWLALAPMFVIAALAVLGRTPMASVWGMAQWFAVTALWLAVLASRGVAPRVPWLRRALPVYWLVVLLAAAAHALWRERTGTDLAIVGGSGAEAMSIAFYAPGKTRLWSPAALDTTPWLTAADWQRNGGLIVCADDDGACEQMARRLVAAPPVLVTVSKTAWGLTLPARSYRLFFSEKSSAD